MIFEFLHTVWKDLSRYRDTYKVRGEKENITKIVVESLLFKSGFHAVLLYRIANTFYKLGFEKTAWFITRIEQALTGAEIEYNATIAPGLFIAHPAGIVIGRGSIVGSGANFYQGITLGTKTLNNIEFPILKDHVTVFAGAKVLGGIVVGGYSVIGANTVVLVDVPGDSVVAGKKIYRKRGRKVVTL